MAWLDKDSFDGLLAGLAANHQGLHAGHYSRLFAMLPSFGRVAPFMKPERSDSTNNAALVISGGRTEPPHSVWHTQVTELAG